MSFIRRPVLYSALRSNLTSRLLRPAPRQPLFTPILCSPNLLERKYGTCSSTPHSLELGKSCWRCKEDLRSSEVFCHNSTCGTIQPIPTSVTFFDVLVGEEVFDVNIAQLKKKYLSLQQQVHPDSYTRKPQKEFECAQVQSAWLNRAYHTLRDPLHRAQYLLELRGVQVEESESLDDPELLMEVLEVREELEDAQTESEVDDIRLANESKLKESIQELSLAFKENDLERAKQLSIQLQYWVNIKKATQEWSPNKQAYVSH